MKTARARAAERKNTSGAPLLRMAKASEQMEKALKVSECVPEIGTELHRERLLSKLLDEAVVDGDPQTILLFKGLVRAAGEVIISRWISQAGCTQV